MPSAPVAVIDALNSLLEAEQNSMFRFMGEGSPYLSRATADVRRPLGEMVDTNARHAAELAEMIENLGGYPLPRSVRSEEQYLAFLSLKFLLPKLVDELNLTIKRYDNAIRSLSLIPLPAARQAIEMLKRQQAEYRAHLDTLEKKSAEVIAASRH